MHPLSRILLGFLISVVGYLMASKTQWFLDILGRIDWAERNFTSGGSRLFYKLLGITIIFIGFLVITDLFEIVIGGFISSIF